MELIYLNKLLIFKELFVTCRLFHLPVIVHDIMPSMYVRNFYLFVVSL